MLHMRHMRHGERKLCLEARASASRRNFAPKRPPSSLRTTKSKQSWCCWWWAPLCSLHFHYSGLEILYTAGNNASGRADTRSIKFSPDRAQVSSSCVFLLVHSDIYHTFSCVCLLFPGGGRAQCVFTVFGKIEAKRGEQLTLRINHLFL